MEYSFNFFNSLAPSGIVLALHQLVKTFSAPPVILCIGSDLAIGDSLGPICGTMLKEKKSDPNAFIYGTLKSPVTA